MNASYSSRGLAAPSLTTASYGRRVAAYLVDGFVSGLVLVPFVLPWYLSVFDASRRIAAGDVGVVAPEVPTTVLLGFLLSFSLGVVQWWLGGTRGFTIGKKVLGIRILDELTAQPIGMGRFLLRQVVLGVTVVGFLSPLFDQSGRLRGWHDRAARSAVTEARPTGQGSRAERAAAARAAGFTAPQAQGSALQGSAPARNGSVPFPVPAPPSNGASSVPPAPHGSASRFPVPQVPAPPVPAPPVPAPPVAAPATSAGSAPTHASSAIPPMPVAPSVPAPPVRANAPALPAYMGEPAQPQPARAPLPVPPPPVPAAAPAAQQAPPAHAYPQGQAYPEPAAYPQGQAYPQQAAYPQGQAYPEQSSYPQGYPQQTAYPQAPVNAEQPAHLPTPSTSSGATAQTAPTATVPADPSGMITAVPRFGQVAAPSHPTPHVGAPGQVPPYPAAAPVHVAAPQGVPAVELDEDVEMTRLRSDTPRQSAATAHIPPSALLRISDGTELTITDTVLIGRNPAPAADESIGQLVRVQDPGRSVSKTHLLVGVDEDGVWLVDRASTNGTVVTLSDGQQIICTEHQVVRLPERASVTFGDYSATFVHRND